METRLKDWPEWFKKSPVVSKIILDAAAETVALRKAARNEIERLRKEFKASFPALQKGIDDAISELQRHEKHRQELLLKHDAAYRAKTDETRDYDRAVLLQEKSLLDTCDPAIQEAIKFFADKISEARKASAIRRSVGLGDRNAANNKREIFRASNYASIVAAIGYMRAAIDELEAMKLIPECDHQRIEALKNGIPSLQEFVETRVYDVYLGE
jgi:uncharacterized protein YjaZ